MTKPKKTPEPKFAAALLKSWMHTKGLTSRGLASMCGVSDTAVNSWREGKATPGGIPLTHLVKLSGIKLLRWMGQS